MRSFLIAAAFLASATCLPAASHAAEKTIILHPAEGESIPVAKVMFSDDGTYRIDWDDSRFGDFFLSMRPFKCLEGAQKLWCRVEYPYPIRRSIADGDLTDLEYDMLFVWKNASDYGINMWNGVYYRLTAEGGVIQGTLHEMDMDVLAAPPEDGSLRPITADDLDEGDPDSHWLPRLSMQ